MIRMQPATSRQRSLLDSELDTGRPHDAGSLHSRLQIIRSRPGPGLRHIGDIRENY
jgi:hypothetical protein